jgi:hypothetical protein
VLLGKMASGPMKPIFPESLTQLQEADPEVYGIIEDEKDRQWCGPEAPDWRRPRRDWFER